MQIKNFILLLLLTIAFCTRAQDTIQVGGASNDALNKSITDKFTIYESYDAISIEEYLRDRKSLIKRKSNRSVENLDFTSSTYFIDFVLVNNTSNPLKIVLETARPITNEVKLFDLKSNTFAISGDAIPFTSKSIWSNRSVLPIELKAHESKEYVLQLASDGEAVTLPMIFWEKHQFEKIERTRQFNAGIFYGIFVFVVIIYFAFFLLLRDRLFFLYTIYVALSALLQAALDGYVHEFIFTSGTYFTHHSVILIAGTTVFFALTYATNYLELEGRNKRISTIFRGAVILTTLASLIPGAIFEFCYPLINIFSLLSLIFLLVVGVRIRKRNKNINRLFLVGLFSLLTGAIVFVLGNIGVIDIPEITQYGLKAGTLVEIICLSILMAGKYKSLQDEKEEAQKRLLAELEEKNRMVSETNIRLETEVQDRTREIEEQRQLLKKKNEDFLSSVKYAERIQSALLSNEQKFKSILPDSFVIFQPKDIVSGDFYWIEEISPREEWPEGLIVYATADCTGHGVPGAFVSIICNNLLKLGKSNPLVQTPGQALDFVNAEINETLNSEYSDEQIRDGMDVALCAIDPAHKRLYFSGAKNGVYIVRNGEIIEIKGDRRGIGYLEDLNDQFTTHEFQLKQGDQLYTFSDGFVDQFGGPKGKKFTSKRLKEVLLSIEKDPMNHQESTLENTFDIWKDEESQVDDVLLIGVRIS